VERRLVADGERALGHVDSYVADALDVHHDLENRRDETEVARGGLAEREHPDALLVDRELALIHLTVAVDGVLRELAITIGERLHRIGDLRFDERPHRKELVFESTKLCVERLVDVRTLGHRHQPYRPEM